MIDKRTVTRRFGSSAEFVEHLEREAKIMEIKAAATNDKKKKAMFLKEMERRKTGLAFMKRLARGMQKADLSYYK